jgi:hypothetical protein
MAIAVGGWTPAGAAISFMLEHVPEKWTRFSDKDMLQVFELARILFDQVIPPDRKAR